MKRISNAKLLSGAGLDFTAKKTGSSSTSTSNTNSESNASDASDVRVKKKSRRKVRCTQEFNLVERRSLFPSKTRGYESARKATTKKKKNLDFLPKVCLDIDIPAEKENSSPNIETSDSGDVPKAKKIRKKKESLQICLPRVELNVSTENNEASVGRLPMNTDSTPEEKRDSEIVFKKRKKKSKKTKEVTSEHLAIAVEHQIEMISEEKVASKLQKKSSFAKTSSILKIEKQLDLPEQISIGYMKHTISSGDIYIEDTNQTFEIDTKQKMNPDLQRKSVRFRSTFEVEDISNISGMKSIEEPYRDEGSFKRYRKSPYTTLALSKSKKSAQEDSPNTADKNRGNVAIITPSPRENTARQIDSKTSFSRTPQNRRSTFEMPSPIPCIEKPVKSSQAPSCSRRTRKNKVASEIDLITPPRRHKRANEKVSVINLLTPTPKKSDRSQFVEPTPSKLLRESTFTMEERVPRQTQCNNLEKTPRTGEKASESVHPLDIPKSNGRRRWDKSLGVSIFDSSGNLHNISPPWAEGPIDLFLSNNTPKESKKMLPRESVSAQKPRDTSSSNLPANKKQSLRFELLKKSCNGKLNESKNGTMKRPKMPNFALIHQRAFDKLENLQEMSQRKAARAKLLLSGLKPASEAPVKAKSPAKSKKMLLYSPKPSVPVTRILKSPRSLRIVAPSVSNPKVLPKFPEKKPVGSHIPKLAKSKNFVEKQKFTKLGFKVGADALKKTTKEEQVKAVVNKSKVQTNTVATRRNAIQNVRSNRRFELLMNMRQK